MNETANQELGQVPVGKLMARFAIPCIMSGPVKNYAQIYMQAPAE